MASILIAVYSQTGVSLKAAQMLREQLGADLYEIRTKRAYNTDMWKAWEEAQAETATGKLPELAGRLPDLSKYDAVILGGPVWGFSLSNPLLAFLRQADLTGKTVSAFWTFYDHDEKYAEDLEKECHGAEVKPGLSLPRSAMGSKKALSDRLGAWVRNICLV